MKSQDKENKLYEKAHNVKFKDYKINDIVQLF